MATQDRKTRKWYQKKRYIIPIAFFGLIVLLGAFGDSSSQTRSVQDSTAAINSFNTAQVSQVAPSPSVPVNQIAPNQPEPSEQTPLSNDNYYTNSAGNTVHSPAYAPSIPAGATAQCRDGTYSFSQSRRGTCSHHGGVARWL